MPKALLHRLRVGLTPTLLICLGTTWCLLPPPAHAQAIIPDGNTFAFASSQGVIYVELRPDVAPKTVANFLSYVNSGAYANTFFNRLVPGFVLQGGDTNIVNGNINRIPTNPPVVNEYNLPNVRGTLAMAKLSNDPNSATDTFFFNLIDNSANLAAQNGGYTVFGQVVNVAGSQNDSLAVMDAIAADRVIDFVTFSSFPVINYFGPDGSGDADPNPTLQNLIFINSIAPVMLNSVWIVNANGTLTQLTNAGAPSQTAGNPASASTAGAAAIDNSGNVWSVSTGANTLNESSRTGTPLSGTGLTGGGLNAPASLAIDGAGTVWVANQGNNTVSVFSSSGSPTSPASGMASTTLATPSAIAIDNSGSVWVANKSNATVTKLLGAATPVVAPLSLSVADSALATRP